MRIQIPVKPIPTPTLLLRPARLPSVVSHFPAQCASVVPSRALAQVRSQLDFPEVWFDSSCPPPSYLSDGSPEPSRRRGSQPPDERTLKLGKTLQILQERLPSLLASPLPPEILSPHISLHLFPSTHPHLPTASGRVAYHAALWTAPMAWGRVPIVGNVKLVVLSERVVPSSGTSLAHTFAPNDKTPSKTGNERLIVKWKTCGKTKGKRVGALYRGIGASEQVDKISEWLGGHARDDEEFCGLFIFEFDEEGRILSHTIEHMEGDFEGKLGLGGKMVSLTEWLLGRMNGQGRTEPALALGFSASRRGDTKRDEG